jgi:endonuclease/exonuclease/phosphatase family metal-dependent hydrolase
VRVSLDGQVWKEIGVPISALSARDEPSADGVRVLTLNLFGRRGAWADRRSVLIAGLRELRPDLVAFQEAIVSDGYDQVVDLLGPDYHIAHQTSREVNRGGDVEDGQGSSIASRWPLGEVRELDLHVTPRTADFACGMLVAEIRAPEPVGPLLFIHHKPSWKLNMEYERELQAVAAAQCIEALIGGRDLHVVLVGALDADPDAASVRFWTGRQSLGGMSICYRDAWESAHPGAPGHTFTPRNPLMIDWDWPFRRIDYVFVRCGEHGGPTLDVATCALAFDEPVEGVWASDHFGVLADLAVPAGN